MSARLTDADLAAIEARANAATEGPWPVNSEDFPWWNAVIPGYDHPIEIHESENGHANIEFIGHARTDVPALLDDLREARAALVECRDAWTEQLGADIDSCCPHLEGNTPGIYDGAPDESRMDALSKPMIDETRRIIAVCTGALPTEGTKP